MNTEPSVNILVELVDSRGRKWVAAGLLGPLVRHEAGLPVESLPAKLTQEHEMRITALKVVTE